MCQNQKSYKDIVCNEIEPSVINATFVATGMIVDIISRDFKLRRFQNIFPKKHGCTRNDEDGKISAKKNTRCDPTEKVRGVCNLYFGTIRSFYLESLSCVGLA